MCHSLFIFVIRIIRRHGWRLLGGRAPVGVLLLMVVAKNEFHFFQIDSRNVLRESKLIKTLLESFWVKVLEMHSTDLSRWEEIRYLFEGMDFPSYLSMRR